MRTKLFIAFFVVILTALVSNFIFERLIIRDFEEYAWSAREDQIYVVLASVEGSYARGAWDMDALEHALRWAVMLGFEARVDDDRGRTLLTASQALEGVSPTMRRRIESLVDLGNPRGEFQEYPLFVGGDEIGSLWVRPLGREGFQKEKGEVFKRRGKTFLLISFLIAGGGALFLSFVFSFSLTMPLKRLKGAAEAVARGDLTARVRETRGGDEVGRLIRTFNRMVEALEREEGLRRHLTSNIAHELRTPLAVMKANLEAAIDGVFDYDREKLEGLASEVDKLTALIEGIEDVTKAEASFFAPAAYERLDLADFLSGIAGSMAPLFREKGVALDLAAGGPLPVVSDAEKLERVTRNILTNALVHTPAGGRVSVACGRDKKTFFVEISDTGRGMAQEELSRIFQRFYRGEGSKGLGLGLAIVKELVEVMRGDIGVTSAPGEGTTFRVTLPDMEGA
ncbi:MAG: ATP-binding protein [Thermodesulfovibrionales bacterium]